MEYTVHVDVWNVMVDYLFHQYVLPMELITSDSFGKWMQVFQSVVNREVPQVRILLARQFHVEIHTPCKLVLTSTALQGW